MTRVNRIWWRGLCVHGRCLGARPSAWWPRASASHRRRRHWWCGDRCVRARGRRLGDRGRQRACQPSSARIVVTDDQGRYLLPDLPEATYDLWVRGYGLVDSAKVQARPGSIVDHTAVVAPTPEIAAEGYPAQYWFSLLQLPVAADFPGTGATGNGMAPDIRSQGQWVQEVVGIDGCTNCHQLGNKATRTLPTNLGAFDSSAAAWERRVQSGPSGATMWATIDRVGKPRAVGMYADWTDRIAAGELPAIAPQRPQGVERNVVITLWDWADARAYLHDAIASDKRNPRVNAHGTGLRGARGQRGLHRRRGSAAQYVDAIKVGVARSKHSFHRRKQAAGRIAILGGGAVLGQSGQCAQFCHGQSSARVGDVANPRRGHAGVLPAGIDSSVSARLSDRSERASDGVVANPPQQTHHHHRSMLRDAPPELCRGRQQHALVLRWRRGRRLVQHEALRRDQGRGEGAGLDGAGPRHQRKWQAGRLRRGGSADCTRPGTNELTPPSIPSLRAR